MRGLLRHASGLFLRRSQCTVEGALSTRSRSQRGWIVSIALLARQGTFFLAASASVRRVRSTREPSLLTRVPRASLACSRLLTRLPLSFRRLGSYQAVAQAVAHLQAACSEFAFSPAPRGGRWLSSPAVRRRRDAFLLPAPRRGASLARLLLFAFAFLERFLKLLNLLKLLNSLDLLELDFPPMARAPSQGPCSLTGSVLPHRVRALSQGPCSRRPGSVLVPMLSSNAVPRLCY